VQSVFNQRNRLSTALLVVLVTCLRGAIEAEILQIGRFGGIKRTEAPPLRGLYREGGWETLAGARRTP